MKVLYVISSHDTGRGGHYHSLDHISRAMRGAVDARIVSIGSVPSPVLSENPLFLRHLAFSWNTVPGLHRQFRTIFDDFEPDVVHCFDMASYLVLQLIPAVSPKPMVLTRCGGPNPRRRFCAVADPMVVFSRENYEWFSGNRRFKRSRLHLIPNRVRAVEVLPENHRVHLRSPGAISLVRIARIGPYYEKSLRQTLELVRRLEGRHEVHLFIIGVVESPALLEALRESVRRHDLPVTFITDGATKRAAKLLYLADIVVGTGRGVMEAMSLGVPVLAPAANVDVPVLVDEETFEPLFDRNFSERSVVPELRQGGYMERLERLMSDPGSYQRVAAFSREMFARHFAIEGAVDRYLAVYRESLEAGRRRLLRVNILHILHQLALVRKRQEGESGR